MIPGRQSSLLLKRPDVFSWFSESDVIIQYRQVQNYWRP